MVPILRSGRGRKDARERLNFGPGASHGRKAGLKSYRKGIDIEMQH